MAETADERHACSRHAMVLDHAARELLAITLSPKS
jgi:hypothetical protein